MRKPLLLLPLLLLMSLLSFKASPFPIDPNLDLWTKRTLPSGHYVNIVQISTPYGSGVSVNTIGYPGAFEIYYDFFGYYNETLIVPPSGTVQVAGYFMYNDVTPHLDRKYLALYLLRSDLSGYLYTTRILDYARGEEPNIWYYKNIVVPNLEAGEEFKLAFGRGDLCDMDRRLEASWTAVEVVSCRILKVPSQYATLQEAVDEAAAGDTVEVASGTYFEHVLVDKDFLKIVGNDKDGTVIDALMGSGSDSAAVSVSGNNVLFKGFTVQNCINGSGIEVYGENVTVLDNNVVNNTVGIKLLAGEGKIVKNNIYDNSIGVWMQNTVQHFALYCNSFYNNTINFYQQPPFAGSNTWDNGFEGNFWSNYTGVDSDGDGVGDVPHVIDEENVDYFPLMKPYMVGDINHDGKIDMKDVSFVARRFGSVLGDLLWSPRADINEDMKVDMRDISAVAKKFGQTWS
jgi:hypothetical protein